VLKTGDRRRDRRGTKTPRTSPRFGGETHRTSFWRLVAAPVRLKNNPGVAECSFCRNDAPRAVSGRRRGATPRIVCAACADAMRDAKPIGACDFCDHPSSAGVARGGTTICGDCLEFARQALGDDVSGKGDEARLDTEQLWSDLTPAPRPDVDPDSPATAHADLALAFFEMGLFDDAREQVAQALKLDPLHPVALHVLEKLPAP
jgi:hypothetical protein